MNKNAWTDYTQSQLIDLWASGFSGSRIATELGMTRSQVLGKVHRMNLPIRATTQITARKPLKSWAERRKHTPAPRKISIFDSLREVAPMLEMETGTEVAVETRKTLMQLTDRSCRWPIGHPDSPDFFFCGVEEARLSLGRPYCPGHLKAAWRPA
jgi:GcrA cell cycle regulator